MQKTLTLHQHQWPRWKLAYFHVYPYAHPILQVSQVGQYPPSKLKESMLNKKLGLTTSQEGLYLMRTNLGAGDKLPS